MSAFLFILGLLLFKKNPGYKPQIPNIVSNGLTAMLTGNQKPGLNILLTIMNFYIKYRYFTTKPVHIKISPWFIWRSLTSIMNILYRVYRQLTHFSSDRMAAISQTFSKEFSWMRILAFWLKFSWTLFLRVQLTISQHWFRHWLGAEQATSHCLNQWWPSSLTNIRGRRWRWVNTGACQFKYLSPYVANLRTHNYSRKQYRVISRYSAAIDNKTCGLMTSCSGRHLS